MPVPRPTSPERRGRSFHARVARSTAARGRYGSGFGASITLHGAILATLSLTVRPRAAPADASPGRTISATLAVDSPPPARLPDEVVEPVVAPETDPTLPYDELDLPEDPEPDPFREGPKPPPAPAFSLFETVVYPRIEPLQYEEEADEEPTPEEPAEVAEAEEAAPAPPATPEPTPTPSDDPASRAASPEPIEGACPPPPYPRVAARRGWTGTVTLLIEVAPDGTVDAVRVEASSGYEVLDEAAVRAVRDWRFTPALEDGVPVRATVRKPISFRPGDRR